MLGPRYVPLKLHVIRCRKEGGIAGAMHLQGGGRCRFLYDIGPAVIEHDDLPLNCRGPKADPTAFFPKLGLQGLGSPG